MRSVCRFLIVLLLFAAIPLRGHAALAFAQCEMRHGGASMITEAMHEHGAHADHATYGAVNPDDPSLAASSTCSLCAGCCVGSPVAPHFACALAVTAPSLDRTPFFVSDGPGHVPGRLDRPPLAL